MTQHNKNNRQNRGENGGSLQNEPMLTKGRHRLINHCLMVGIVAFLLAGFASLAGASDGGIGKSPADTPDSGFQKTHVLVVVGWGIERHDGGRGAAIVLPHYFRHWLDPNMRTLILNLIVWSAKIEVPSEGVNSQLDDLQNFGLGTGN